MFRINTQRSDSLKSRDSKSSRKKNRFMRNTMKHSQSQESDIGVTGGLSLKQECVEANPLRTYSSGTPSQ